jgi:hypothetical protein
MKHGNQTEYVQFGERIGLGWTMGEEVEFIKPVAPAKAIKRFETVYAVEDSCLLQLKLTDLEEMTSSLLKQGAGMTFKPDHLMLMSFLESNFDTKQEWRIEQGIVEGETKEGSKLKRHDNTEKSFMIPAGMKGAGQRVNINYSTT